jgi:hypothetical protein
MQRTKIIEGGDLGTWNLFRGLGFPSGPPQNPASTCPKPKKCGGHLAVLKGLTMRIFTIHTPRKLPKYKNYKIDTIEKPVIVLIRLKNHHQREFWKTSGGELHFCILRHSFRILWFEWTIESTFASWMVLKMCILKMSSNIKIRQKGGCALIWANPQGLSSIHSSIHQQWQVLTEIEQYVGNPN